jgi:hypothetical protein
VHMSSVPSLSCDRATPSSTASSPRSARYSLLFRIPVSSLFLKDVHRLLHPFPRLLFPTCN